MTTDRGVVAQMMPGAPEVADLSRLHGRLERMSEEAGLLDVAFTTVDSPIGELLLASTEHGLVRIAFETEAHYEVLAGLAERISPRVLRAPRRLEEARVQLDEYFRGERTVFDVALDLSLSTGFREGIQRRLCEISYGATESYAAVAQRAGSPKAVRAVGSACATNPLPVVVPCHRVVRSDGSLGGYSGGLHIKTALLELEAG